MKTATGLEEDLKKLIVETLMLEEVVPQDIENDTSLFDGGLGLDSIDALELGMAISKKYKIKISQDQEHNREYFANVNSLAAYIRQQLQVQESH